MRRRPRLAAWRNLRTQGSNNELRRTKYKKKGVAHQVTAAPLRTSLFSYFVIRSFPFQQLLPRRPTDWAVAPARYRRYRGQCRQEIQVRNGVVLLPRAAPPS